jgi:hypothetical protein
MRGEPVSTNSELVLGFHFNTYRPQRVNAHAGETSARNGIAGQESLRASVDPTNGT